ncbi:MAG: hypothetical protein V2B15_04670 [Bacteroidota bacterium]
MKRTEIISDKVFEQSMLTRLDQTRALLQSLVDAYHALDLQNCDSSSQLYDLIYNTDALIKEGVYKKQIDGNEGMTDVQIQDYRAKLIFKNPNPVKELARKVQQDPFTEMGSLWTMDKGRVILNMVEAEQILKKKSVFITRPDQEGPAKDLLKLHELFNKVNKASSGALNMNFNSLFVGSLRADQEHLPVSLNIETVKKILAAT